MAILRTLLAATAAISTISAASIPTTFHHERFVEPPPKWNFANATTSDAKPDGSQGVIIEPDLELGKPGKDGGIVKKIKFGPYKLQPGQKKEFPIGAFGLTPIEPGRPLPCTDCYITAMQLNLEYEDGKIANVDTGAWYVFLYRQLIKNTLAKTSPGCTTSTFQ
jgi:hypothetical protein